MSRHAPRGRIVESMPNHTGPTPEAPPTVAAMDVTDATFEAEVAGRSDGATVVVDLWAPWCGPCRQLGPILEKVVGEVRGEAGDGVVLAKVNIDENPRVAASFGVQSIPAVFAVREGKVVDGFVGAQGEDAVRAFVAALLPSESETRLAGLIASGDEASLRQALEVDPGHVEAVVGLAELLVGRGSVDEALALLARVPETAETRRVAALARVGDAVQAGAGADAGVEDRLDALLPNVKDDEEARQAFIDLLELLGPTDPRTARYRKALTAAIY